MEKASRIQEFIEKCREKGVNVGTAYARVHRLGWDIETALNTPNKGVGSNQTTYSNVRKLS